MKNKNQKGTIIILNGPSSSGKSSIQEQIQQVFDEPYLKIGIDNFFVGVLGMYYIAGPYKPKTENDIIMQGIPSTDEDGNPVFTLKVGPAGQKIISGIDHAIAAYAGQGNNIIVDYILYEEKWLKELVNVLKHYQVFFIGIDIPLDILEQREKARGTSPVGHARSHYQTVHGQNIYDLKLDTSKLSANECALAIKELVETKKPCAFKQLEKYYNK